MKIFKTLILLVAINLIEPFSFFLSNAEPKTKKGKLISYSLIEKHISDKFTNAGQIYKVLYKTKNQFNKTVQSSGMVMVPKRKEPESGRPVIAWAHGTTGLGDICAPSKGALGDTYIKYLNYWLGKGYIITASDFAGLGTKNIPNYLNNKIEALSVIDSVKILKEMPFKLNKKWVSFGHSAGAAVAIGVGQYAKNVLDFRGSVAFGASAYLDDLMLKQDATLKVNQSLPFIRQDMFQAYTLASIRSLNSDMKTKINGILTDIGLSNLTAAEKYCVNNLEANLVGDGQKDWYKEYLATIPNFSEDLRKYFYLKERGYFRKVLVVNSYADNNYYADGINKFIENMRKNNQKIQLRMLPSSGHLTLLKDSLTLTNKFMKTQMKG